jgi:hypothetical protein
VDKPIDGSMTRCDWHLNNDRIQRTVEQLVRDGWVRAGSVAARVISSLAPTHPHLAKLATTGKQHAWALEINLGADKDPKVWWTKPWARVLAELQVPMAVRRQYIREIDLLPERLVLIEAAHRIGGYQAVKDMTGDVLPPRCKAVHRTDGPLNGDTCKLAEGHGNQHSGVKGSRWIAYNWEVD